MDRVTYDMHVPFYLNGQVGNENNNTFIHRPQSIHGLKVHREKRYLLLSTSGETHRKTEIAMVQ